jgi:hypothetical protein
MKRRFRHTQRDRLPSGSPGVRQGAETATCLFVFAFDFSGKRIQSFGPAL